MAAAMQQHDVGPFTPLKLNKAQRQHLVVNAERVVADADVFGSFEMLLPSSGRRVS